MNNELLLSEQVSVCGLQVSCEGGRVLLNENDFQMKLIQAGTWRGSFAGLTLWLRWEDRQRLSAQMDNNMNMSCDSIQWVVVYKDVTKDLTNSFVPCAGMDVFNSGLFHLGKCKKTKPDSQISGLYLGANEPCLFLGTKLPQKNLHLYQAELKSKSVVKFTATTYFTEGQRKKSTLHTETTFIFEGLMPLQAMTRYSEHVPQLLPEKFAKPLVGWNSWDYYFSALTHDDIIENADVICNDSILNKKLSCIIIDMGWEHREGEWYANYRFTEGMEKMAEDIRIRGLTPGIWTNGCQVQCLSYPALRMSDMLIRIVSGAPLVVDGMYVLDPTHPIGKKFLFETYSRLYGYGYRIFKVDFVSALLKADRFYDPECGPYDAIRQLFSIVRLAVGENSHIIGCSYPVECGPSYVNSSRIGVDIHNQWSHVRWVLEYLQLNYWQNGRTCRIDTDFLVVRGKDTSLEEETNVFNPNGHLLNEEGRVTSRWRYGPVFDRHEAETWAAIVSLSGGNIILSDRLSKLNAEGWKILYNQLETFGTSIVPLDLGETELASLWYGEMSDGSHYLLIINLAEQAREMQFCFEPYNLVPPETTINNKNGTYEDGTFTVMLQRHESVVLHWQV